MVTHVAEVVTVRHLIRISGCSVTSRGIFRRRFMNMHETGIAKALTGRKLPQDGDLNVIVPSLPETYGNRVVA